MLCLLECELRNSKLFGKSCRFLKYILLLIIISSQILFRLFDPRGQSGTIVHSTLQGHDLWVSCVTWSPDSDVELVSGSYDGRSLLWDIRSPKSYLAVIGKCYFRNAA